MTPKLRDYLSQTGIKTFEYLGNRNWLVTKNNSILLAKYDELRNTFKRLNLKPLSNYKNYDEFMDDFNEKTHLSTKKSASYEYKYIDDKYAIHNYFLLKELQNTEVGKQYFKFTEFNYWENERWSFYILDSKENRKTLLYLQSRFRNMEEPDFKYTTTFLGKKQRLPMATSRFEISSRLYSDDEAWTNAVKKRSTYISGGVINQNLPISVEMMKHMDDLSIIDTFYKGKLFETLGNINKKVKYLCYHKKYSDSTFKKLLFKAYQFKDVDKAMVDFEWYHSDDDYMTYEIEQ